MESGDGVGRIVGKEGTVEMKEKKEVRHWELQVLRTDAIVGVGKERE